MSPAKLRQWRHSPDLTLCRFRCWAYSAVGAIEGIRYIKTDNLTELSMQQLIDCDKTDLGCHGGLMDQAYQYEDTVGLCAAAAYPMAYHRHYLWGCSVGDDPVPATWWHNGNCRPLPHTRVRKFVDVDATERALTEAVATQPVSVAVAAGDWQFYAGGVLDTTCDGQVDHGVLAVSGPVRASSVSSRGPRSLTSLFVLSTRFRRSVTDIPRPTIPSALPRAAITG